MVRTHIRLTADQLRRLRSLARQEGVSLAEIIRRCVDRAVNDSTLRRDQLGKLYQRAATLIGRYRDRDGATDLAAGHDRYLDELLD